MIYRDMVVFSVNVLISLVLVLLVDLFTFKYEPGGSTSGNGNPGLFILVPALLYSIGLFIYTFFFMKKLFASVHDKYVATMRVPILLFCFILIFSLMALMEITDLKTQLGGFADDPGSVIYRFGWLNQYTNTVFYNIYVLFVGMFISSFVSWSVVRGHLNKQSKDS